MKYFQVFIVLVVAVAILGCESLIGLHDDDNELEAEETLHAEDLAVGDVSYTWCNGWKDEKPTAEKVTVDVFFSEEDAHDAVSREQIDRVTDVGGTVIHEYNVPALRADLTVEAIPGLVERRQGEAPWVDHVRSVPDAERQDVVLIVRYAGAVSDEDKDQIAELGGEVRRIFESINALSIELPDQSVQTIRSQSNVAAIGLNKVFCTSA